MINRDILKDIENKNLVSNYDISKSDDVSCLQVATIDKDGMQVLCELYNNDADVVNYLINDMEKKIKQLEHKLKEKNRILKEIYNRCDQMGTEIEEAEGSYSYYFEELKGLLPVDKED